MAVRIYTCKLNPASAGFLFLKKTVMVTSNSYTVFHILDGDNHDFNTLQIPAELLLALSNHCKREYNNKMAALAAPSFREERARQTQRYLEYCEETGTVPKQIFIDFPIP